MLVFFGFVAHGRQRVRAARDDSRRGVVGRARGRAAGLRDPARQQRPRRPDRTADRASARSPCGSARARARALYTLLSRRRARRGRRVRTAGTVGTDRAGRRAARDQADPNLCARAKIRRVWSPRCSGTVRFQLVLSVLLACRTVAQLAVLRGEGIDEPAEHRGLFERYRVPAVERHVRHGAGACAPASCAPALRTWRRACRSPARPASPARATRPTSAASFPRRARAGSARGSCGARACRSCNPGASGGTVANIGCASHCARNAATPSRSTVRASTSSDATRVARSTRSTIPGDALTSTSARTRSGRSIASRKHRRPPIE